MLPNDIVSRLLDLDVIFGVNASNIIVNALTNPGVNKDDLLQTAVETDKDKLLNLANFCLSYGGAPTRLKAGMKHYPLTAYLKDGVFEICSYGQPYREFNMRFLIGVEFLKGFDLKGSWLVIDTALTKVSIELPPKTAYEA